jgi:hypothetical protein
MPPHKPRQASVLCGVHHVPCRWFADNSVCYKCPTGSITDPLLTAGGATALTDCGACTRRWADVVSSNHSLTGGGPRRTGITHCTDNSAWLCRCPAGCPDRYFGDPVNGCKACPANSNRATNGWAAFPGLTSALGYLGPCVCDNGYLAINFANGTLQRCVLDCPAGYYVDSTGE